MPRVVHDAVKGHWTWEGKVQDRIRQFLEAGGWAVTVADTEIQERGIDVEATKDGHELLIEVKGYPSDVYASGPKAGKRKPTQATLQARHWYSHALLTSMKIRDSRPNAQIAIGLPRKDRYVDLVSSTRDSLRHLGIGVLLVPEVATQSVEWFLQPAGSRDRSPDSTLVVEIGTGDEAWGRVAWRNGRLDADARQVSFLDSINVVEPGNPGNLLRPSDGDRYLIALAFNLRGGQAAWARLIGPDGRILDRDEVDERARDLGFDL